jgi:hypothetical protein
MHINDIASKSGISKTYWVRFLHAAPIDSCADVFVNNAPLIKGIQYKKISKYYSFTDMECRVEIILKSSEKSIYKKHIFEHGKTYLLVITDRDVLIFEINGDVPLGESKMRFLHLASKTPSLDFAVKDRDVVFPNVPFCGLTEYLGLTPMTVDLELRTAGSKIVILPLNKLQFKANQTYTLALVGTPNNGFEILILIEKICFQT